MCNKKEWIISYFLNNDFSVGIMQLKALPEFDEVGEYSEEECEEVIKIIQSVPIPKFEKTYFWGDKTLEEWNEFVEIVNNKIKELV
jgi:hypothetical protein